MSYKRAADHYQKVNALSSIEDANAHRVIQLLMNRAAEKLSLARNLMAQQQLSGRGEALSIVIAIIGSLHSSLDFDKGGEIAKNLAGLYDYMKNRLLEANLKNDIVAVEEVQKLFTTVKSAWDDIAAEAAVILQTPKPI